MYGVVLFWQSVFFYRNEKKRMRNRILLSLICANVEVRVVCANMCDEWVWLCLITHFVAPSTRCVRRVLLCIRFRENCHNIYREYTPSVFFFVTLYVCGVRVRYPQFEAKRWVRHHTLTHTQLWTKRALRVRIKFCSMYFSTWIFFSIRI